MKLTGLDVAIAGAGVGGLALGTMLARFGASVTLYDQMDAPRPVGSGFVLQPTGAQVLSAMGLLDPVAPSCLALVKRDIGSPQGFLQCVAAGEPG